jgi:4-amino-4-deoxy-L-arabinose transferase-like glycosyltransferase
MSNTFVNGWGKQRTMFQLSYLLKDAINRRDISSEVGGLKKSSFGQARVHIFVFLILFVVMLTGIHHPYLWVPDEPREAEIARETLVDGHWVTPHLCGLPFLEKPPLFYDIIAAAYALTGSISPSVARVIPVVFGMIMLAAVFWFCNRWAGPRTAWLSVLVLLTMPKFYGYSHLILLDIAVGTFCTVAIVAFAFWLWWADSDVKKQALLCLFYLASAGAFMTKGFAGLFHIVVIVGVFVLITRRWQPLCKLICAWPIFVFIIPVGIWVYLF